MNIAVSNLDFNTNKEQLRAAFAVYGSVAAVMIDSDRFTDSFAAWPRSRWETRLKLHALSMR